MKKVYDTRVVLLAERMFVGNPGTYVQKNIEMAQAALNAAQAFYDLVDDNFHPVIRTTSEFRKGIYPKNGFDWFSRMADEHITAYQKVDGADGSVSCDDPKEQKVYLNHEYPEWVVAKAANRNGEIFGFDTGNLVFDGDVWFPQKDITGWNKVQIFGEKCIVSPEQSWISIEMPF